MISQSKWSTSPNDISPNDPSPIDPSPINPSLNDSGPVKWNINHEQTDDGNYCNSILLLLKRDLWEPWSDRLAVQSWHCKEVSGVHHVCSVRHHVSFLQISRNVHHEQFSPRKSNKKWRRDWLGWLWPVWSLCPRRSSPSTFQLTILSPKDSTPFSTGYICLSGFNIFRHCYFSAAAFSSCVTSSSMCWESRW